VGGGRGRGANVPQTNASSWAAGSRSLLSQMSRKIGDGRVLISESHNEAMLGQLVLCAFVLVSQAPLATNPYWASWYCAQLCDQVLVRGVLFEFTVLSVDIYRMFEECYWSSLMVAGG
jgi:hypothetical protein